MIESKRIIVSDNLTEIHFPDLFEFVPIAKFGNVDNLEAPVSFRTHVSYYKPESDSFDEIVLSNGTIVQPVYARHLRPEKL